MLIGDLTVTGPFAGSTIESSERHLGLSRPATSTAKRPGGVIRVVGDVVATGFGSGNGIEFYADRFELDAATGSVAITSSGGALAGELEPLCRADPCRRAASILDQLAADPQYAGYQDDLNAPAAVQRPEGVLSAANIWIDPTIAEHPDPEHRHRRTFRPDSSPAVPILVNDDDEIAGPPGSIDLIVNGQLSDRRRHADRGRGARRTGRRLRSDPVHRQQHDQRLPADRVVRIRSATAASTATAIDRRAGEPVLILTCRPSSR